MQKCRLAMSFLVVATVLFSTAACGRGGGGGSGPVAQEVRVTVKQLAGELSTTHYDQQVLAKDLKIANGGTYVDESLASKLRNSSAVDSLLENSGDVADLACDAWDIGLENVAPENLVTIDVSNRANALLDQMLSESAGDLTAQNAITMICNLKNLGKGA